jgi:uncharacterized protein (DUF885 family)
MLDEWFTFFDGYDPLFSWWCEKPYKEATEAIAAFRATLGKQAREHAAIPGEPCGREALLEQLECEFIPYSPEELIEIGDREFAWCEAEMRAASEELGFGSNWKAAREHVKESFVEPGEQPWLVRDMAREAVSFLRQHDLLTIPPLAEETWRIGMMSPEKQKVNPFFLGGEQIIVSYPTGTMTGPEKRMSMRGNNPHFSRATVQHELIPGHHMQFFMLERHRPHRSAFETCFWIEGWALYWEMVLWDHGFPRGPKDRIGMLFWRMHRCARISFSLRFHLGLMSTGDCVDYLVDHVGHERANAEGEVRRSFNGDYPPLYQAAYMLGGLQLRALQRQIQAERKMPLREFHDEILRQNQMPIAVLRAVLLGLSVDDASIRGWRFY